MPPSISMGFDAMSGIASLHSMDCSAAELKFTPYSCHVWRTAGGAPLSQLYVVAGLIP